jgi:hypothetical protein
MRLRGKLRKEDGEGGEGLGEAVFGKAAGGVFGGKAFASGATAAGDDVAAFRGFEAREEAVLALATFEGGLVGAFHNGGW